MLRALRIVWRFLLAALGRNECIYVGLFGHERHLRALVHIARFYGRKISRFPRISVHACRAARETEDESGHSSSTVCT